MMAIKFVSDNMKKFMTSSLTAIGGKIHLGEGENHGKKSEAALQMKQFAPVQSKIPENSGSMSFFVASSS